MVTKSDDATIFANTYGLLDQIELASRTLQQPVVIATSENHPTHWLVAGLYRGFEKLEDNGMNFMAFPKKLFSLEDVQSQLRRYMGENRIEISKDK